MYDVCVHMHTIQELQASSINSFVTMAGFSVYDNRNLWLLSPRLLANVKSTAHITVNFFIIASFTIQKAAKYTSM